MAQPKVAIRLGTEGKQEVVNDFKAVGDAGDLAANRAAKAFERAAQDMEAAQRKQVAASSKLIALMPTDKQTNISLSSEKAAQPSTAMFTAYRREQHLLERQAEALRAALDPLVGAQKRYDAEMAVAQRLVSANKISLDEYCAKLKQEQDILNSTGPAHEAGIDRTSRLRYAYQSLGYQIQDIGASLSTVSGPSGLFRIFAQQGGQVFDALNQIAQAGGNASKGTQDVGEASDEAGTDLGDLGDKAIGVAEKVENTGGKFGKFAAFMSGPWGAAIMVGMSVLGPMVAKLFESGEASEEAAKAAKEHATAIDSLIEAMERETRTADQLTRQKYADAWAERQSTIETERKTQALIAQAKARMALADAQGSDGTGEGGVNFGVTAAATQEAMIATLEKQAKEAQDRIDAITLAMNRQQSLMTVSAVEASRDPQKRVQRDYDRAYASAMADREKTGDIEAFARAIKFAQDARDAELKKIQESEKALRSSAAARRDGDSATTAQVSKLLLEAFGGTITSTTGGKHVKGSYHYKGQAVDFVPAGGMGSTSKDQIRALAESAGLQIKELLGPGDKGHSDHFHLAWSGGKGEMDSARIVGQLMADEVRKSLALEKQRNEWANEKAASAGDTSKAWLTSEGDQITERNRDFQQQLDDMSAGTALLNLEWELRGRNREEAQRLLEIESYRLDIMSKYPALTAEQVAELVKAKENQIEMNDLVSTMRDYTMDWAQIGQDGVSRIFDITSAQTWGDRVKSILVEIANEMIRMQAIQLFMGSKHGGGGLFSTILGGLASAVGGSGGLGGVSASSQSYLDGLSAQLSTPRLLGSAIGNSYTPAGAMLVGENGPEIVDMPRGAKVMTASDSRRAMAGESRSVTYAPTYQIDATGADPAALMRVEAKLDEIDRSFSSRTLNTVQEASERLYLRLGS